MYPSARGSPYHSLLCRHIKIKQAMTECTSINLEAEIVEIIIEFWPHRKENTTLHHYKDQLVNAV
jgi:hypothetical protein